MDFIISSFISQIRLGEVQTFQNMQVVPLFSDQKEELVYWTLKEALDKGQLLIQEISSGGSVPELKVINQGDIPVLLLDGEEVAGAKQNRVLNTTILVKEKSEIVIPVSCTEKGRWSYRTKHFYDSGVVSPSFMRAKRASAVNVSLERNQTYCSDQGAVWNDVEYLRGQMKVESPTGAMRDVFEQKRETLEDYIKAFNTVPLQNGILVLVDGEIAGCDIVSRTDVFGKMFSKLIKSYAMDSLIRDRRKITISSNPLGEAAHFLEEIKHCEEKRYFSPGWGADYRFEGPDKVGSVLVVENQVIHMAFFKTRKDEKIDPMSGYRTRRDYRL